jgi:hypothetical protein
MLDGIELPPGIDATRPFRFVESSDDRGWCTVRKLEADGYVCVGTTSRDQILAWWQIFRRPVRILTLFFQRPAASDYAFLAGALVVKNPATWTESKFDAWGAGDGIGVVIRPPFELDDGVDVRWPGGREFRKMRELLPAPKE